MTRRVAIAALVAPALVLVALAARSYRPFRGEEGVVERDASTTFIDVTFTLALVLAFAAAIVLLWVRIRVLRKPGGRSENAGLTGLVVFLLLIVVLTGTRALLGYERRPPTDVGAEPAFPPGAQPDRPVPSQQPTDRPPRVMWPLAAGLGALIVATVVLLVLLERRRSRPGERSPEELDALARALEDAIDDLRREPDPRRAVVAAYARMEQALSFYGLPRRASETPYEYLRRVARELDAEAPVAALTELFEEAKFSEHSVDEGMRGRAIDALVSVRAEVRAAT
ncbi:MAG TPA: DUF4129 domain-containing protein [Gaiellaceae bacterium]|nr:DUF4129 domain-containing protein [Gaiellaceae bacterium]